MRVSEINHQAKLEEWKQNILNCRMSGLTVQQWCTEYDRIFAENPDAQILHLACSAVTTCSYHSSELAITN